MTSVIGHVIIIAMAFESEQKIGKYVYVYRAESYWDKEKKQSRQRRVYLGRRDPKTGQVVATQKQRVARSFKDFGNVYLLNKVADQIGLTDCLREVFPDSWREIITCAFYEISEGKPLYLCGPWLELTHVEAFPTGSLSSQRISDLLRDIGEQSQSRMEFFRLWAKSSAETKWMFYDITSLSTYSKTIDMAEWGYNRDKEKLPQINLGVVYAEPLSLPLFYEIHQGSIPDVSALKNTVEFADHIGVKKVAFIMDRGFYSRRNLSQMEKMQFIIPYPISNKDAVELMDKHEQDISSPANTFRVNKDILFAVKDKASIDKATYHAFIYLDEKKRVEESSRFYRRLIDAEESLREINYGSKADMEQYLSDNFKDWRKYLRIVKRSNQLTTARKVAEIEKALERMGKLILLTNYRTTAQKTISLYRRKDAIEKYFDKMKNDLDVKRLRVHSRETMEGRLFMCFVSLILYSSIATKLAERHVYKDYTAREVIYELRKIKRVQLDRERVMITEVSKKQRELFKHFQVDLPQT